MFKLVVLSCLLAAANAWVAVSAPVAYAALAPSNYRGPLSLAPGQPASVLGSDGRPLDTLEVNIDRSAHYTAKALEATGIHVLKKRSVAPIAVAPVSRVAYAGAPVLARSVVAPIAYSAPAIAAPITYAAPVVTPSNYRGPLSLAPGQPANVLGSDGRPLDTLEVNLDRSAHLTAKALDGTGIHLLKKRSVVATAPVLTHTIAAPIAYSAPIATPLAYSTPVISPLTYAAPAVVRAW
ncbi:hypothetical protein EVAR_28304_1 [Eumeta japonica]|uniref:Cuticle protein n=1 Tax=Eumeta variegata TaxID=151549 RepID=A0A4C1V923_EUMVA|nr:hypothetical protein EVAR_28304_1 [Eumeta japonica]